MTTMPMAPMSCDAFAGALMDYLEHDASVALRGAMDAHATGCAECAALLADFRAVTREAASLPVLEPSRDLWTGIAARIETPVVALAPRRAPLAVRHWRRGLVAAGLVAIAAGSFAVARRNGSAPATPSLTRPAVASQEPDTGIPMVASAGTQAPATGEDPATAAPAPVRQATAPARPAAAMPRAASARLASNGIGGAYRHGSWRAVDSLYGAEIGRLRRLAAGQRSALDPATLAVIEKNLRIIDQAIRESREAIARDPNSALLNDQINRMLDQKVELLRAITSLPASS